MAQATLLRDEIGGEGRDAAPVVNARVHDGLQAVGREVRRRLHAHVFAENDPGHGQRPQHLVEIGFRCTVHLRARLGTKILHDDFLNMAELEMQGANRE